MTYREVAILTHLSKMGSANCFSTKLKQVVIAGQPQDFSSLFLIMDYMPFDLKNLLAKKNIMLSEDHILVILYNILCGINFLHSANIMHRDIKPSNILINTHCHIKICDFGMARSIKGQHSDQDKPISKRKTTEGDNETPNKDDNNLGKPKKVRKMSQAIMTRWYRAPEVILIEKYNSKVDIWSTGCIFAEALRCSDKYLKA
jgi:mitogen-activated protein kinase 1/3